MSRATNTLSGSSLFGKEFARVLKPTGSLLIDIGGA